MFAFIIHKFLAMRYCMLSIIIVQNYLLSFFSHQIILVVHLLNVQKQAIWAFKRNPW